MKKLLFSILLLMTSLYGQSQVKFDLGGRMFVDGAAYVHAPDTFSHGVGIPDVRLRGVFTLPQNWKTKIDVKFAKNKVSLSDAFIQKIHKEHVFRIGFMFGFFGLDQSYSSNDYPLSTGANVAETFYPGRRTGISYNYSGKRYYLSTGVFVGDQLFSEDRKQGFNSTLRLVYRPIATDERVLHLGTSGYFRIPDENSENGETPVTFSNKANTYLSAPSVFDFVLHDAKSQWQWGAEALGLFKHFFFQSEFMMTGVKRKNHGNYRAYGAYAETSWLLKGKMLGYDYIDALPYCTSAPHSLLLFTRVNFTNMNDQEVKGGKLFDATVGLNYYLNKYLVFRLNYSHQWTDVHSQMGKDNWGLVQGRVQFKF